MSLQKELLVSSVFTSFSQRLQTKAVFIFALPECFYHFYQVGKIELITLECFFGKMCYSYKSIRSQYLQDNTCVVCWSPFSIKLQSFRSLTLFHRDSNKGDFSCECFENFKNKFFYRTAPVAVSIVRSHRHSNDLR